jgi:catechol 2,3-dioxygenase-like lactoylglutathione lyase family enzyme
MKMRKVHIALNVADVRRSVEFYRSVFEVEPVRFKPGYAKFDVTNPALNLSLNEDPDARGRGALNHLGIEVADTADVLALGERLQKAGLATFDEMNVNCCYAMQDKTWVTDPDGNRWEVFAVKISDTAPELSETSSAKEPRSVCCRA